MCGRIVQKGNLDDYLERVIRAPRADEIFPPDPVGPKYNVPPGVRILAIHRLGGDGSKQVERIFWGYKPAGAKVPLMSNARLETITAGKWPWAALMKAGGRVLVPADGWYEWKRLTPDPKGPKQPHFIRAVNDDPLYFPALTAWRPGKEHGPEHGIAIVTNDAKGGLIDVHDRRPIVLAPELAQEWMDPATTPLCARDLLMGGLPEAAFRWYPVKQAVGNSRYERPDATDPTGDNGPSLF
ncbi:SOS response-associated peptidase [Bordetella genomosp. 9]|uniref:Abasic site processing protein n=1 Tax=Bordetella genomosp. 9 TaxID=1416803 RepID=A0A1W6Z2L6_9BORD|nr:SOS response-associated peptidase [Bordetella genomosp. 9]ARP87578.1 hypothetical protein CAL13_16230 [Bordetella genomosp. 9]